jgi:hypothetical protein
MTDLWDQLALIESAKLKAYSAYIERREQQWLVQFLTALRNDFEGLKGLILHCSPLPFVDSVVSELLAEEIRLQSYSKKGILSASNPSLLAVPSKQFSNHHHKPYISLILSAVFVSRKVIWKLSVLTKLLVLSCYLLLFQRKHRHLYFLKQIQVWLNRSSSISFSFLKLKPKWIEWFF